jgi:hypothetical protein
LLSLRGVLWGVSQSLLSEAHFSAHDVKNKDFSSIKSVKNTARWFHDLAVRRVGKLLYDGATFWVFLELPNMGKDALDKRFRSVGFVDSDVVGDSIQIA